MNKLDLIITVLDNITHGNYSPQLARQALADARELRELKPVAWMCAYKYEITDNNVEYVLNHAQDGKDYMMGRLDDADNDAWRGKPVALYDLGVQE